MFLGWHAAPKYLGFNVNKLCSCYRKEEQRIYDKDMIIQNDMAWENIIDEVPLILHDEAKSPMPSNKHLLIKFWLVGPQPDRKSVV